MFTFTLILTFLTTSIIVCVYQGGIFMLQLMDSYGGAWAMLIIALVESLGICWIYGLYIQLLYQSLIYELVR